jgi:hypothetical protein
MIIDQTEIVTHDDCWVMRRASASQHDPDTAYLFWTGSTWRYNSDLALRFSSIEAASRYNVACAKRMTIRSAFTSNELKRLANVFQFHRCASELSNC